MNTIQLSILIPTKNEEKNLGKCLDPIVGWANEVILVDSQSTDNTINIAKEYGVDILQFKYAGGWPKKRQWALDTYNFKNDWILLLDSDEVLLPQVKKEIERAIQNEECAGYWLKFQIYFLGRLLKYGDTELWKLSLFKKGHGQYEKRLVSQDQSMADMEVHEHVIVEGITSRLESPIRHENINSLSRYIDKHNEYSNWEAKVYLEGGSQDMEARFFGSQAERRRWLRKVFLKFPGVSIGVFFYLYILRLGFLDGHSGFVHAAFKAIQIFHIKAKIFELKKEKKTIL